MNTVVIIQANKRREYKLTFTCFKGLFNLLKLCESADFVQDIIANSYTYLIKNREEVAFIVLTEEMLELHFNNEMDFILVENISGSIGVDTIAEMLGTTMASATTAEVAGIYAASMLVNAAVSIGINLLGNLLTPNKSFDPTTIDYLMRSNLFTGAQLVQAQGGAVPLVYGQAYCGGTLISSASTTIQGF